MEYSEEVHIHLTCLDGYTKEQFHALILKRFAHAKLNDYDFLNCGLLPLKGAPSTREHKKTVAKL